MTPEQYAYYQQPQQQEEGGLLDFLGKAALAAGAVAGGIAGTRYLRGRMAQQAPPREAKRSGAPNYAAVRRAAATQMPENPKVTRSQTPPSPGSTADRVRRMEQITREARAERMPGVIQTDLASLVAQTGAPSPSLSAVPVSATPVRPVTGPIVTDLSRLQGQATELPSTYYSRQPGSFADITSAQREITGVNAAERLSQDPELLSLVRQQKAEELSEARSMQAKAQAEYRNLIRDTAEEKVLEPLRATPKNFLQERLEQSGYVPTQVEKQQSTAAVISDQSVNAVYSAEDQQTGRVKQQLQRNEDVDLSRVDLLEDMAEADRQAMIQNATPSEMIGYEADAPINRVAAQLPDGLPVDQAEDWGLNVLDLQNKQSFRISPRALSQEEIGDPLAQQARQYLRAKEIDTDFDYSAENKIQAAQVRDRVEKARTLQAQAEQILADIRNENQLPREQLSPEQFAAEFNKTYREELNDQLQLVDNARQRAELRDKSTANLGEDIDSLLTGGAVPIETTMRGKALRGGKPGVTGDVVYQDAAGEFVSADTGLKTRLKQGTEYKIKAQLSNELNRASDEDLTELITMGQQASMNQYLKNLVASKYTKYGATQQLNLPVQSVDPEQTFGSAFDEELARMASEVLRTRASKRAEPTSLQLDALDRSRVAVAASQEVLQQARNLRPTVPPGPAQDVARSMETLRRGMIVDPSEPLPVFPSVTQLRTGYVTDEDLGPILGASDVYTGAAAEAAGPVIFTGKSKANSVIRQPRITGAIKTPTGRYLTQDNPDVLGTVYNVAGTRANRAISTQVEANAQAFLADALTGGLQAKVIASPERFVTPTRTPLRQLELLPDPGESAQVSRRSPLRLKSTLGLPGQEPSKRTLYAQYQPGRSALTPLSPFIGDMPGGTVVIEPTPGAASNERRDIGTPPGSRIDLTRRGAKARFFPDFLLGDVPQETLVTGMEPAPIGPLTQSPGLSRIGGWTEQVVMGAGLQPVIQTTTQGQKIAYPRMAKPITAEGFRGGKVTNIPPYGIDPGAEDWRNDLMRSAYRRGGPVRTYPATPQQLGIEGRGLDLLLEYLNIGKS
jgi:hypothetical protein